MYHYVFCDEVARLDKDSWYSCQIDVFTFSGNNGLDLLYVSRQVYQETALLPYELATFHFGCDNFEFLDIPEAWRRFLGRRSNMQIEVLGDVVIGSYDALLGWIEETGTGAYWAAKLEKEKEYLSECWKREGLI